MSKINPNKASKLSATAIPRSDILSKHYSTLNKPKKKHSRIIKSFAMREKDIERLRSINEKIQSKQHKNVTASDVVKALFILAEKTDIDTLAQCFQQSLIE